MGETILAGIGLFYVITAFQEVDLGYRRSGQAHLLVGLCILYYVPILMA